MRALKILFNTLNKEDLTDIEISACTVLGEALKAPFIQICNNAGIENEHSFIDQHLNYDNMGLNLLTEEFCNLIDAGIIDPAKVERVALENAASIASLFLTTDCIIINKKS